MTYDYEEVIFIDFLSLLLTHYIIIINIINIYIFTIHAIIQSLHSLYLTFL